ncbi:MAG: TIGR02757 family protein [Ignavibacteriaceae bacterium]|nr:TIGR02757 family protein [Ignavibacteriaceae bacterium]
MKRNKSHLTLLHTELSSSDLKEKLEYHYHLYDRTNIAPDPLQYPHRYSAPADIELIAFLASVYAFGNVKQISAAMEKILKKLGPAPAENLRTMSELNVSNEFSGIVHRFYTGDDTARLMLVLRSILHHHGSIAGLVKSLLPQGKTPVPGTVISLFHHFFVTELLTSGPVTNGLRFMIPKPSSGSSCKRFNLFLRWMVRKDELDFGLWDFISPSDLIIPVDTHIAQIARKLGLTSRKQGDWKMAEEITTRLREFDPADPVKYDFSLCHIGIRGLEF